MRYERDIERRTRHVLHDLEPELCRQLGVASLDTDFVAELYAWIKDELSGSDGQRGTMIPDATSESLALTVFLVTSTHQPEVEISPGLIPRLRKVITRALQETSTDRPPTRTTTRDRGVRR